MNAFRFSGAAGSALAAAGIVHLWVSPHHLHESLPLGLAFVADGIVLLAISIGVFFGKEVARKFAPAVCLATAAAYVLSRTTGIPGGHAESWDLLGIATSSLEMAVAAWAVAPFFGLRSKRILITGASAAMAIVMISSVMAVADESESAIPQVVSAPALSTASQTEGETDLDRAKPPGCAAITKRLNLYADEVSSPDGLRLGYGLAPGKASIPGPLIELYEGDCVAITLRNDIARENLEKLRTDSKTPIAVSLHVHGVKYTPASDGTAHHNSFVPPGESRTFIWYAAPRATVDGRIVSLGTAGYWWYHDHVVGTTHGTGGLAAGLFGGMIVRRRGDITPDLTHTVVMSHNRTINLKAFPPPFVAKEGQRVEFIVLNVGDDFHTFHLHGHNWADNRTGFLQGQTDETQLIDAKTIGPSESFGFQVIAGEEVGDGSWMLHCHVQTHSDFGMATFFQVNKADGTVSADLSHSDVPHSH
jgi:FtsP/CotA-like multicopper oxidase with cupredoxin domain